MAGEGGNLGYTFPLGFHQAVGLPQFTEAEFDKPTLSPIYNANSYHGPIRRERYYKVVPQIPPQMRTEYPVSMMSRGSYPHYPNPMGYFPAGYPGNRLPMQPQVPFQMTSAMSMPAPGPVLAPTVLPAPSLEREAVQALQILQNGKTEKSAFATDSILTEEQELEFCKDTKRKRHSRGRRPIPARSTEILNSWFFAHLNDPYPTHDEKLSLCNQTGLAEVQINYWFCNKRMRFRRKAQTTVENRKK